VNRRSFLKTAAGIWVPTLLTGKAVAQTFGNFASDLPYMSQKTVSSSASQAWLTMVTPGSTRNDLSYTVGCQLIPAVSVVVTDLGRWLVASGAQAQKVSLWRNSDSALLGSVSTNNTGAAGAFKFTALASPITLLAGIPYTIGSFETAGGDLWCTDNSVVTADAKVSLEFSVFAAGDTIPVAQQFGHSVYVPVNMKFS